LHSFVKDELVKLATRLIVEEALEGEARLLPFLTRRVPGVVLTTRSKRFISRPIPRRSM
jgi:hypothetical protein